MARLWYEGFCNQAGVTDLANGVLSSVTLNGGAFAFVTPGRFYGKGMSFTTAADAVATPAWWSKSLGAQSNAFVHLAVQPTTPTNGADAVTWIAFFDGTAGKAQISVGIDNTSGTVTIYQGYGPNMINAAGDGLAVLATSAAGVVPIGAYSSVEIGLVIGTGSAGSVTVRVQSSVVVSATGVSTQQTANATYSALQAGVTLSVDGSAGSTATTLFTDAYVGNSSGTAFNTYVGPITVFPRYGTSNVAVQFVPKSGANWQMVDETAMDGFATYNADNSVGAQDTFVSATALPAGYTPLSLKVQVAAASDLGTTRQIETVLVSGTTTVTGSSTLAGTTFGYSETYADQDPNVTAAWTASTVLATNLGYKQSA